VRMGQRLPVISGGRLVRILQDVGFATLRQRGSHVAMQKITAEKAYRTVVPLHDELGRGTLRDILRQSGLSKEELVERMKTR